MTEHKIVERRRDNTDAYAEIKDRKGRMVDGIFIKEGD